MRPLASHELAYLDITKKELSLDTTTNKYLESVMRQVGALATN